MEYEHLQSSCKHHIWGGASPYSRIYGKDDYQTWKTEIESKKKSVHNIISLVYCVKNNIEEASRKFSTS